MSAAYAQYLGDGTTRQFTVPFPYFAREHVQVSFDATVQTGVGWINDGRLETSTAPGAGVVVDVRRVTPTGVNPVDFEDGSILGESDLDLLATYSAYLAEESRDYVIGAMRLGPDGSYNADARRLSNLADGVQPGDAMSMRQFTTAVAGPVGTAVGAAQAAAISAADSAVTAVGAAAATNDAVQSAAVQTIANDLVGLRYMGSDLGLITEAPVAPGTLPSGYIKTVADDIAAVRALGSRPDVLLSGPGLVAAVDAAAGSAVAANNSAVAAAASAETAQGAAALVTDAAGVNATHYPIFGVTRTGVVSRKTAVNYTFNPSTGRLSAPAFAGSGALLTGIPITGLTATLDLGVL